MGAGWDRCANHAASGKEGWYEEEKCAPPHPVRRHLLLISQSASWELLMVS